MEEDAQDSTLEPKDEPIDTIFDIQETEIIFPVKVEPVYNSETETPFTKLINTNPDLLHENIEFPTNSLLDGKNLIQSSNSEKPNEIPQIKAEPSEIVDIEEKEYVLHNSKRGVIRHLLVACPICERKYIKKHLPRHIKTHAENKEDSKRTQCKVCQKMVVARALLPHMRIHTGEKPFVCTYCGKQFGRADKLKLHEMVHTGEKPHACEVCGKSFQKKDYLKIHTNAVHGGEKPFVCNLCNKSFAFPKSLRVHMSVHNRDKKFNCTICNYSCIENGYLKSHMLKHTKESRFECAACGCQFVRADSLNRHVLRFCKGEPKMRTKSKNNENPETTDAEQE